MNDSMSLRMKASVKRTFSACLVAAMLLPATLLSAASTKDYSTYYKDTPVRLKQVKAPNIPDKTVRLTDFGAKGNGVDLCTEAFRLGIEQLSQAGGGHLVVPAGVWLTGPIVLASNIDLHLEDNALVIFSPDKSLFEASVNNGRYLPLVSGDNLHDVSITGHGTMDGNGKYWRPVKRFKQSSVEWERYNDLGGTVTAKGDLWLPYGLKNVDNQTEKAEKEEAIRNDLVRLSHCRNLLFEGVTFQNAPRFHIHPIGCENVILDHIIVRCDWNVQNGDAIDLANVKTGLVLDCLIAAGDDGICFKGGTGASGKKQGPCQDILVQGSTVFHAHGGFVLGSDISGGMKRIVFRDCTLTGTDVGLRFKSGLGRGGKTDHIYCYNIVMNDIKGEAVFFDCTYQDKSVASRLKQADDKKKADGQNQADDQKKKSEGQKQTSGQKQADVATGASQQEEEVYAPEFADIHIYNVVCRESKTGIRSVGLEGRRCVYDIDIHDCTFFYTEAATDIDANSEIKTSDVNYATY